MNNLEASWMRMVRRLEATYALNGREALAGMTEIQAYVLFEEKAVALQAAEKMIAAQPGHERWGLRREQLKAEVNDLQGWLKQHVFNESADSREPDRDRGPDR